MSKTINEDYKNFFKDWIKKENNIKVFKRIFPTKESLDVRLSDKDFKYASYVFTLNYSEKDMKDFIEFLKEIEDLLF